MIYLVHSGCMGNGCEAVFVEAEDETSAEAKALLLFRAHAPKRKFPPHDCKATPLKLDEVTECDGW